jgi:peptide/nickel transport system substrate-binding protein
MTKRDPIVSLIQDYDRRALDRRSFLRRAMALGVSMPAATALLAACGSSPTSGGAGASSGTLTYRPQTDMANLDPAFWTSQDDEILADCIFEGLVSYRPGTFDVVNTLAESLEASADQTRFHFKLKQGIHWHKGYGEVRASDVKYSFERIAGLTNPKLNSPYAGDWQALETVKVEGPYQGTIILKEPFAPLMYSTLPVMSGKILPQKAVEKLGHGFGTSPVGSGPYEFVSWVPKQAASLQRFTGYSGANSGYAGKTAWQSIRTQPMSSDNTAVSAMQTGEVLMGYLGPSVVPSIRSTGNVQVLTKPTQSYQFLALNVQDEYLRNRDLRLAIRYAVDVPSVLSTAYGGLYVRANSCIPPSMPVGHWGQAPQYNQDLVLAKSHLKASGMGSIPPLRFAVLNDETDQNAAQVIAADLQKAGIGTKIELTDSATMDDIPGAGGGGKNRQLVYNMYTTEPDPYWSYVWWTCAQMGLWNWDNWCNVQFDGLLSKAVHATDTASRHQLYEQAAQTWDAEASIVWIAFVTMSYGHSQSVRPVLRPDGIPVLWTTGA